LVSASVQIPVDAQPARVRAMASVARADFRESIRGIEKVCFLPMYSLAKDVGNSCDHTG
jgi:hypothetical protein